MTFAFVMPINLSPSKLFPFTNFPLRDGPEADLIIAPFVIAGNCAIYLIEGFRVILVLNGLYPFVTPP